MGDAELFLSDEDRPNEAMLDEAMESEAPTEPYEKLWRKAERPIRLQLVLPEWTGIPAQEIVLRAGEEKTI